MSAGLTVQEHLVELAETFGVGVASPQGVAGLPSDTYELNKLLRKYNEGLRLLVVGNPQGWFCLRTIESILLSPDGTGSSCIDGSPTEYRLPDGVTGQPMNGWEWEQVGTTLTGQAESSNWNRVSQLLAANFTKSWPSLVAVEPYEDRPGTGVSRRRWKALVYSSPDLAYQLKGQFYKSQIEMREKSDRHPFGAIHDPLVLAAARWAWVMTDMSDARYGAFQEQFVGLLAQSIEADLKNAPEDISRLRPRDPNAYRYNDRSFTFNGVLTTD